MDRFGSAWVGLDWLGLSSFGLDCVVFDCVALGWDGLGWDGMVWFGLVSLELLVALGGGLFVCGSFWSGFQENLGDSRNQFSSILGTLFGDVSYHFSASFSD